MTEERMTASDVLRRNREHCERVKSRWDLLSAKWIADEYGDIIKRLLEKYDIGASRVDEEFGRNRD